METDPLDLALVVDTTGSMGTHLGAIRRRLLETVDELDRAAAGLRLGVVAFKDHGREEAYVTRSLPLEADRNRFLRFLLSPRLAPGAGGGGAEAVECALRAANGLAWRPEARKALVLIGDRPPHGGGLDGFGGCPRGVDYRDEVEALARRGVAIYAVHVGDCLETRRVFEYFSARTGGTFLDLRHARDLPSSIVSVCLKETGCSLGAYRRRLKASGRLTPTCAGLIHALAG